jgi:glycosyltransferase involved in cell wall biosynthesis
MACGKPVICTDVGGTDEIVEHGVSGYLVPPRDPTQLARHLTTLLTNPALAAQIGAAAKCRVESESTLEHSVSEIEKFITDLVRSNEKVDDRGNQP